MRDMESTAAAAAPARRGPAGGAGAGAGVRSALLCVSLLCVAESASPDVAAASASAADVVRLSAAAPGGHVLDRRPVRATTDVEASLALVPASGAPAALLTVRHDPFSCDLDLGLPRFCASRQIGLSQCLSLAAALGGTADGAVLPADHPAAGASDGTVDVGSHTLAYDARRVSASAFLEACAALRTVRESRL